MSEVLLRAYIIDAEARRLGETLVTAVDRDGSFVLASKLGKFEITAPGDPFGVLFLWEGDLRGSKLVRGLVLGLGAERRVWPGDSIDLEWPAGKMFDLGPAPQTSDAART